MLLNILDHPVSHGNLSPISAYQQVSSNREADLFCRFFRLSTLRNMFACGIPGAWESRCFPPYILWAAERDLEELRRGFVGAIQAFTFAPAADLVTLHTSQSMELDDGTTTICPRTVINPGRDASIIR